MRKKQLTLNTITSLGLQVITIICGFILPRLILNYYGSEVNGFVNSVTQFLAVISFFELGVGAVVQSALYKPLADRNNVQISRVMVSAGKFFRSLAGILCAYIIVLIFAYPYITNKNFGFIYTAALITAISISSFAQYYFGIVNNILLSADQKGYIHFTAQALTIIANTLVCAILIKLDYGIHIVKLTTSLIFLVRPLFLQWYVNSHYNINRKIIYEKEPINQKWNGVAQHLAAYILEGTDILVLTVCSTLSNVSVYSVYHLIINGVKQMIIVMTNGIQSLIGELWAKQEIKELKDFFSWVEWGMHTGSTFLFGCTSVLIVPFIEVYTTGITDANYIAPIFALLITIAYMFFCFKTPYQIIIIACNHFKQTQKCFIIAAVSNLIISVLTVKIWGIIGVAIGTLIAMIYQTIWMALYNSKHLIKWQFGNFIKQLFTDLLTFTVAFFITINISLNNITFLSWFLLAVKVALCWSVIAFMINIILYKNNVLRLSKKLVKR